MNPFTLPGPQFLRLYLVVGLVVLLLARFLMRRAESGGDAPRLDLKDAYAIAYLRGGTVEAVHVATFALLDRGLLRVQGRTVVASGSTGIGSAKRSLDRALLMKFNTPAAVSAAVGDSQVRAACQEMASDLKSRGLLATDAALAARRSLFWLGMAILLGVAGIKLLAALNAGHSNVEFLLLMAAVFWALLFVEYRRQRTKLGDRSLAHLRSLFARLRRRSMTLKPGGETEEAALLAAVFGVAALARGELRLRPTSFPTEFQYLEFLRFQRMRQQWLWRRRRRVRWMRQLSVADRVGLGWRPELAAGILSHLDEIDVVEVLIEDCLHASRRERQGLAFLARHVPVIYHGVTLGLVSAHTIDSRRLDRVARFLDTMQAPSWSEHLAFVRAGGIEIGHLAAPPRAQWTVDAACENLRRIERVVGTMPALENIATLLEPPGSTLTEPRWIDAIASQASAPLLLDLHNLACNALNNGAAPAQYLEGFPLERAITVHLSGGQWIGQPRRLLDDHLHPVPALVFELLEQMAGRVYRPLTVIIERDGNYPPFHKLINELRQARRALAAGRSHEFACV